MKIHLRNIILHAYHGLLAGEAIIGSDYEINLTVNYYTDKTMIDQIDETIDYTALYSILKNQMANPRKLLETLAMSIASEIIAKFSLAEAVEISIFKLHPPIQSFDGSVGITYKLSR